MFRLVFRGELLDGYEPEQVMDNLSKLLKQDSETIRAQLFIGVARQIKQVDSEQIAFRWRDSFAKAGALLEIIPLNGAPRALQIPLSKAPVPVQAAHIINSAEPLADMMIRAGDSLPPISQTKQVVHRTRLQQALVTIQGLSWWTWVALVVVMVFAIAAWFTRVLWQPILPDTRQQAIVSALVAEQLALLGQVHVEEWVALESLTHQQVNLQSLPGIGSDFWISLERSGIRVRDQVNNLWVAGYRGDQQIESIVVATGTFEPHRIRQWLKSRFTIESDVPAQILFHSPLTDNCVQPPQMMAIIAPNMVIIGVPARVVQFKQRLQNKAVAVQNLGDWLRISANQLATIGLFEPKQKLMIINGVAGTLLGSIANTEIPARGLFLGIESALIPPRVQLSAIIASDKMNVLQESQVKLEATLSDLKSDTRQNIASVLPIYERIKIVRQSDHLRASVWFDKNMQQELQLLLKNGEDERKLALTEAVPSGCVAASMQ